MQGQDFSDRVRISRRALMGSAAVAGAGMMLPAALFSQTAPTTAPGQEVRCAFIGLGKQGQILLDNALRVPGVRVVALCDIWSYSQKLAAVLCTRVGQTPTLYDDYRKMLDERKDLDAVIVATPDFWHAPVTNDALQAGCHVYCEKEMAHTLDAAASMVRTARKTGKLLQIGHQRRSSPWYRHALDLLRKDNFCGNIHVINGQWNQFKSIFPVPERLVKNYPLSSEALAKWGFASMEQFREWRWFKSLAGGPMSDLGSHQVDIFNWFLGALPVSVSASGSIWRAQAEAKANNAGFVPECLDCTLANYEWRIGDRTVFGHYQVNLNTTYGFYWESFEGDGGTIVISERQDIGRNFMFKEPTREPKEWEDQAEKVQQGGQAMLSFKPGYSKLVLKDMTPAEKAAYDAKLKAMTEKPIHQWHLENFFDAVRGAARLNCPADEAYATAVCVLKANESAVTGRKIAFKPEDFIVR